jgi:hypothetical protein
MTVMMLFPQAGILISCYEGTWKSVLPIFLCHLPTMAGCLRAGRDYRGITKSIGLPHGIGVAAIVGLTYKLTYIDEIISLEKTPISFYWAHGLMGVLGTCAVFDLMDAVNWFILGNRTVTRSQDQVDDYVDRGYLKPGTGLTQQLLKGWVKVDEDVNDNGFLKDFPVDKQ